MQGLAAHAVETNFELIWEKTFTRRYHYEIFSHGNHLGRRQQNTQTQTKNQGILRHPIHHQATRRRAVQDSISQQERNVSRPHGPRSNAKPLEEKFTPRRLSRKLSRNHSGIRPVRDRPKDEGGFSKNCLNESCGN